MTTTRKHWTLFWLAWAAWLIASVTLSRGSDIVIEYDDPGNVLTLEQKQKIGTAASLWDHVLLDNGLTGPSSVITFKIKPEPLPGGLAWTPVSKYAENSRGIVTVDGQYPIIVMVNTNAAPATWDPFYTAIVLFHEFGHGLGFGVGGWKSNGYVDGYMTTVGGIPTFVLNNRYVGPSLATYRAERDPLAEWIPMADDHYKEPPWLGATNTDPWYYEIMTTGISSSGWMNTFIDPTTWAVAGDNGWTLNSNPPTGRIIDMLKIRRWKDEDIVIISQ